MMRCESFFFFALSKQILGITRRIGILSAECLNPPGPARHMRLRPRDTGNGNGLHGHEARPDAQCPTTPMPMPIPFSSVRIPGLRRSNAASRRTCRCREPGPGTR
ncbi:hypothetical protein PVAP13_5NG632011 [Panicum virgatum]|uniref:Uncharacterized protein n=1 Tax=Panicum virgatum TaxID=38727 RepID=A0A8T0S8C4_PANVG|nr:hypothetical protein PVAP13_5NG632011 [Panicum virgatum]